MDASIYQSGEYLDNNPDWHASDARVKAGWISAILQRNGIVPKTLVEIGCGSGEILVHLADTFPATRIFGYDISPQACRISATKATDRLTFREGDYLREPIIPTDLLMAIDVFEHVEDYMAFIRAMQPRATLKLFHIPLDLSVQGLLRGNAIPKARKTLGHLHYFCKESALATLQDCGYEIVDWNYTFGTEELPNRALRTRLFNYTRKALRLVSTDFAVRLTGGASMMVMAR